MNTDNNAFIVTDARTTFYALYSLKTSSRGNVSATLHTPTTVNEIGHTVKLSPIFFGQEMVAHYLGVSGLHYGRNEHTIIKGLLVHELEQDEYETMSSYRLKLTAKGELTKRLGKIKYQRHYRLYDKHGNGLNGVSSTDWKFGLPASRMDEYPSVYHGKTSLRKKLHEPQELWWIGDMLASETTHDLVRNIPTGDATRHTCKYHGNEVYGHGANLPINSLSFVRNDRNVVLLSNRCVYCGLKKVFNTPLWSVGINWNTKEQFIEILSKVATFKLGLDKSQWMEVLRSMLNPTDIRYDLIQLRSERGLHHSYYRFFSVYYEGNAYRSVGEAVILNLTDEDNVGELYTHVTINSLIYNGHQPASIELDLRDETIYANLMRYVTWLRTLTQIG